MREPSKLRYFGYSPELCRFISPDDAFGLNSFKSSKVHDNNYVNNYFYTQVNDMQLISDKIFNLSVNPFLGKIKSKNNSDVHWKSEWFKTEKPSFFVFSNTKIALVDWDIKTYRGSLNFNETENQSLYIEVGNGSAFLGYDLKKKKFGLFADINLFDVGYDGRYIDIAISFVGIGCIFGVENKKIKFKLDFAGPPGIEISIDFGQIIKDLFGWEW